LRTSESQVGEETVFQKNFHKKFHTELSLTSLLNRAHHDEMDATACIDVICSSQRENISITCFNKSINNK